MTKTLKKKQIILAALLLAANISASAQGNGLRVDSHLPALHERNATVCKYPRNLRVQNGKSVNKYIFQS